MATTPDCLESLLGLSRGGQACFPLPADPALAAPLTASATGLYLDETEGLRLAPASNAQAATDLYQRLALARTQAAGQVRAALETGRATSYGQPLYRQRGTLGGAGNGQLLPVGTPAKLTLSTNYRREGAWRITRLLLYTDRSVLAAPLLLDGEQVALLSTDGAGNATGLPAQGLLVPLDGQQHTLQVLLPEDVRLKSNTLFAGCFSCQAGSPWSLAVKNNLTDVAASTPGNGFSLTVAEECVTDPDFLCYAVGSDYQGPNGPVFRCPDLARFTAYALQFKAAALFVTGLLATQQVNRYTMLEPKGLAELRDYYEAKLTTPGGFSNFIGWLNSPDGLGQVRHPCFGGAPVGGPAKVWTV